MSIVVFWLEDGRACAEPFDAAQLSQALARCEALRQSAAAGASVSHVCISSELEQNVTKPGAADPPADYAWTKRRGGRRPPPSTRA